MNPGSGRGHPAACSSATIGLHLACRRKLLERPLHGACAGPERQGQGRARPRLAVGEQRDHRCIPVFDRRRQHDDFVRATRRQRKPLRSRVHARERPKLGA